MAVTTLFHSMIGNYVIFPYFSTRLVRVGDFGFNDTADPSSINSLFTSYLNFNGNIKDNGELMKGASWSVGGHSPRWYYFDKNDDAKTIFYNTPWEYCIYLDQDVFLYSSLNISELLTNYFCINMEIKPIGCIDDMVPEIFLFRSVYFDMSLSIVRTEKSDKSINHYIQFKFKDSDGTYCSLTNTAVNIQNNNPYFISIQNEYNYLDSTLTGSGRINTVQLIVNNTSSNAISRDLNIIRNITAADFKDTVNYTCAIGRDILPNGDAPPKYSNFCGYINKFDISRCMRWKWNKIDVNDNVYDNNMYPYEKHGYVIIPIILSSVQFPLKNFSHDTKGYLTKAYASMDRPEGWNPLSYATIETRDTEYYGNIVSLGYDEYSIFKQTKSGGGSWLNAEFKGLACFQLDSYLQGTHMYVNENLILSKTYAIGRDAYLLLEVEFCLRDGTGRLALSAGDVVMYTTTKNQTTGKYKYMYFDRVSSSGVEITEVEKGLNTNINIKIMIDARGIYTTVSGSNASTKTWSSTAVKSSDFDNPDSTLTVTLSNLGKATDGSHYAHSYISKFSINIDGVYQKYNPHYPPSTIILDGGDDSIKADITDTDTTKFDISEDLDIMMVHTAHRGDLEEMKLGD